MRKSQIAIAALISATCLGPALAQNQPAKNPQAGQDQRSMSGTMAQSQSNQSAAMSFITRRDANTWLASDLMGKSVYGSNDEDIGEIGDILLNKDGRIVGVVLDVGGFLGLGETNVAVPMDALQFQDNASGTTGTGTTGTGMTGTRTPSATDNRRDTTAARTGAQDGPDRIVLIVTKEELESAPKFEDDDQATGMGTRGNAPTRSNAPSDTQGNTQRK